MGKITRYKNCTKAKIKNRRLAVGKRKDGGLIIAFKVLDGSLDKRSIHNVIAGKIVETAIVLSPEAAEDLLYCLYEELTRDGTKFLFRKV